MQQSKNNSQVNRYHIHLFPAVIAFAASRTFVVASDLNTQGASLYQVNIMCHL